MLGRVLSGLRRRSRPDTPPLANPLEAHFFRNPGRLIYKWRHYFDIYHRHLERFRDRSPVVVEIGVFHGGSLEMWRDYFGPGARIVGLDIAPECKSLEGPQIEIMIGSQSDRAFLAEVRRRYPRIDVLIDDGGHTMEQQIVTFEELYPHVRYDGVYLCEDLHTSYWARYGGGYRAPGTFIERAKGLVDHLHGWHSEQPEFKADAITRSTYALHFYDSVLVVEKRPIAPPEALQMGKPSFPVT
jgi:hypothetical protein